MVEGIELHNVSKSRGLMPYAQQKATFYLSLSKRQIGHISNNSVAYLTLTIEKARVVLENEGHTFSKI